MVMHGYGVLWIREQLIELSKVISTRIRKLKLALVHLRLAHRKAVAGICTMPSIPFSVWLPSALVKGVML